MALGLAPFPRMVFLCVSARKGRSSLISFVLVTSLIPLILPSPKWTALIGHFMGLWSAGTKWKVALVRGLHAREAPQHMQRGKKTTCLLSPDIFGYADGKQHELLYLEIRK